MAIPVEQFQRLFRGREVSYGQFTPKPNGEKHVVTHKTKAPAEAWKKHVAGKGPYLGIAPIRLDSSCFFGAIDLDDDNADHIAIEAKVRDLDLPLIVCRSKSGGAHLYVFFKEAVPAKLVQDKLKEWVTALGVVNPDKRAMEVFPKQIDGSDPTHAGSWINLPYYGGNLTERYAIINGRKATFFEFLAYAVGKMVSVADLDTTGESNNTPFKQGPPCLISLHGDFPKGTRNNALYNIAVYKMRAYPEDWEDRVHEYNEKYLDPPLSEDEVDTMIRSVAGHKEYKYKCNDTPIVDACDRSACKKRKFGIGMWRAKELTDALPDMKSMVVITTDPPQWGLVIGGKQIWFHTDDLLQYRRFKKRVMEGTAGTILPGMKQHEWEEILQTLMENKTVIEAPEDAGVLGQFKLNLYDFLQMARQGHAEPRALTFGKPFIQDGKIFFRSSDLDAYLKRKRFFDYKMNDIFRELRRMGGDTKIFQVEGQRVRAWSIPIPEDMRTESFKPVDVEGADDQGAF
jgi:hypothetical protein